MKEYSKDLLSMLDKHRNESNAVAMEAYMRNQFQFYGIKAAERKSLSRPFMAKGKRPKVEELDEAICELWNDPHREVQFIAMELVDRYKKELDMSHFNLLEKMIINRSWWDTVDYIASTLVGSLVRRFPKEGYKVIEKWRNSGNMWLVRTCILFQLKYKDDVDEELLFSLIRENIDDQEFFIRKAIGWSLRQYGKFKPERVRWFVANHELSGLSRREALKLINA